jgi:hypothetical protein
MNECQLFVTLLKSSQFVQQLFEYYSNILSNVDFLAHRHSILTLLTRC